MFSLFQNKKETAGRFLYRYPNQSSLTMPEKLTSQELKSFLREAANILGGKIDSGDFKALYIRIVIL